MRLQRLDKRAFKPSYARSFAGAALPYLILCWATACNDTRPTAPDAGAKTGGIPRAGHLSKSAPVAGKLSASSAPAGAMSAMTPTASPFAGAVVTASASVPAMRMLWQNTASGDRSIWLMNGTSWDGSYASLPQVPPAWSIAGSGDFNADGNADIVWQNTSTGDRSIWFMSGTSYAGSYALLPQVPVAWSIAGVGDFNADGKPDLVWQNTTTGDRSIWFMNGSTWNGSYALLPQVSTQWSIAAVGDFNGDGKPDLVWQNTTTGERSIWFMDAATWGGSYASLLTVPTAWRIAAAADFDGDADLDLVWQNILTGERSIWLMTGSMWDGSYTSLPTVPVQWSIAGVLSGSPASVVISSISPATMLPGASITISGSGFSATPGDNAVAVNGVAAAVTAASATGLTATVPTTLPCTPTHNATVRVTTAGATGTATQSLRVGTLRNLAVGASLVVATAPEVACNDFPAVNGRYIVSVFNTTESPTAASDFRIRGSVGPPVVAGAPAGLEAGVAATIAPIVPRTLTREEVLSAREKSAHADMLEMNRAVFPMIRAEVQQRKSSAAAPRVSAMALPAVGDTRVFRVNNGAGTCSGYTEITARVAYVGTRAILYEDVAAPLAGMMDSHYTLMGQAFDLNMYASVLASFADPLLMDALTDADQRIGMVFTKLVNDRGLGGFVISCDFGARNTTTNTSSNFGEFFYARVPTVAGTGYSSDTKDYWYWTMRTTVVHELKHIASFAWRILNNAAFEASWLEESGAMHAEELWLRGYVYPAAWKSNITYAASIFCEVRPTFPQCGGRPIGIYAQFNGLYNYLENPGSTSPFGRINSSDFSFYYSGWSLIRWAADRFASSEVGFFQALTQSFQTGTANLQMRTGASTLDILGNWPLALYLDGNSAFAGNTNVDFPSWNVRDIYLGLNADYPSTRPKPFPLIPIVMNLGDVYADNTGIRGGSFAMFDFSGSAPIGRAISLVGFGGTGSAATSLRIAIARVQ